MTEKAGKRRIASGRPEHGRKRDKDAQGGEAPRQRRPFETLRALLLAVLLALGIRSFVVEPFKIPSGSMIPTLLVGDYIIVNKFSYGIRAPRSGRLLVGTGEPERGDVVVFRWPDDERIDYIKRIVGLPGDQIEIREGRLWVNGQPVDRVPEDVFSYYDYVNRKLVTKRRYREVAANGVEYTVIRNQHPNVASRGPWEVPPAHYFMMGDNRDNSKDSRLWDHPFVSPEQIKGKAVRVHWSWVVGGAPSTDRGAGGWTALADFIVDFLNTLWRVVTLQVEEIRWDRIGRPVPGLAD